MRKILILIALAVAALTGCSTTEGEPTAQQPSASKVARGPLEAPADEPTDAQPEPEPVEEPTPTPERPQYGEFGGVGFTYEDGIVVTVSVAEAFEPSEWAVSATYDTYVRFDVTLTNGTDVPFDPSGVFSTLASGGREGEAIFDTESGLEGQPMTPVLPGGSVTWTEGYGVADPADLTLQVTPSFEHDAGLFVLGGA
jgi:putative VirB-like lipoprotein